MCLSLLPKSSTESNIFTRKWQYEKQFRIWRLRKYTRAAKVKWKTIVPRVRAFEQRGQECEVRIDGLLQSLEKVHQETTRPEYQPSNNIMTGMSLLNGYVRLSLIKPAGPLPALPLGVCVRAITTAPVPALNVVLPFQCFEQHFLNMLCASDQQPRAVYSPPIFAENVGYRRTLTNDSDKNIDQTLQELASRGAFPVEPLSSAQSSLQTPIFASALHRSIVWCVANNFAGIEHLSKAKIFEYLRSQPSRAMYQMMHSMPHLYTTQALALNLFGAAIEAGDESAANFLLANSRLNVRPSDFLRVNGIMYSPLGRAASLGHTPVVKVLLNHGADINITALVKTSAAEERGVFNSVVQEARHNMNEELLSLLLDHGAEPSVLSIKLLIAYERYHLVLLIVHKFVSQRWQLWSDAGIFVKLFQKFELEILPNILRLMIEQQVDINHCAQSKRNIDDPLTVVDAVAERGDLSMIRQLCEAGARLTADTLSFSIRSKNVNLVSYILQHPKLVDKPGRRQETPLSEAIRCKNDEILQMVTSNQCLMATEKLNGFQPALLAALRTRNIVWATYLIQDCQTFNWTQLSSVIIEAVGEGDQNIVSTLISAGADVNMSKDDECYRGTPLSRALENEDVNLIRILLDADAYPNYHEFFDEDDHITPAITLAADTGNQHIVDMLVNAGADLNPLTNATQCAIGVAVQNLDKAMVDFLIRRGCDINAVPSRALLDTVLTSAVGTLSIEMVNFVLDRGADIHDPKALYEALSSRIYCDDEIFDQILQKHYSRYRNTRPWGAEIFRAAICFKNIELFQKMLQFGGNPNYFAELDMKWEMEDDQGYYRMTPFGYSIGVSAQIGLKYVELILQGEAKSQCSPESIVSDTARIEEGSPVSRETAFLVAIGTGYSPVVELLLEEGADVNFPPELGVKRTPLQKAAETGNFHVVEILFNRGADVNAAAAKRGGGTALQLAAMKGYQPIVRFLLEKGAHVNAPASEVNGRTALEAAAEHARVDTLLLLLSYGAGREDLKQISRATSLAREQGRHYIVDILNAFSRDGKISSEATNPVTDSPSSSREVGRIPAYDEVVDRGWSYENDLNTFIIGTDRERVSSEAMFDELIGFDEMET